MTSLADNATIEEALNYFWDNFSVAPTHFYCNRRTLRQLCAARSNPKRTHPRASHRDASRYLFRKQEVEQ